MVKPISRDYLRFAAEGILRAIEDSNITRVDRLGKVGSKDSNFAEARVYSKSTGGREYTIGFTSKDYGSPLTIIAKEGILEFTLRVQEYIPDYKPIRDGETPIIDEAGNIMQSKKLNISFNKLGIIKEELEKLANGN